MATYEELRARALQQTITKPPAYEELRSRALQQATVKQPETQQAPPASAPVASSGTGERSKAAKSVTVRNAARNVQRGETAAPAANTWRTKTVQAAVGGSRGGKMAYRDVEVPTLAGRAADVISGTAKSTASNLSNMMTTLYQAGQEARTAENERTLADYQFNLDQAKRGLAAMEEENRTNPGTWNAAALQSQQYIVDDAQRKYDAMAKVLGEQVQERATEQSYQVTDALSESSAQDVARAKRGLGKGWQTVVDASVAGLQMGGDIALGAATGGGALLPMALRGFGGAAQEARQEGATLGQQLAYGAGSAAVSVATEQLSNVVKPFAKAFGTGISDDLVEAAIGKAVERLAKTAAGKTALEGLLKTGTGFVSEGAEEALEDLANPLLKLIYRSDSAKGLAENIAAAYQNNLDPAEVAYDFLIGGILGGLGGAVESGIGAKGTYQGYQTEVQNAAIDNAYDVMREKGMFSQEARRAVRDAEDIMPKIDPGGNIAWGRMMERVAPERQEAFTEARRIADRFGADLVVDQLANGAAGEYRGGVITIDPTAANPVRQVLVHELTHHMETSGLYGEFSQKVLGFIAEDMGVDVDALRRSITREYGQSGVQLDEDGASRELVAKFAESKLFQDEASIQRLLRTDRNLFQKVYDWIRDTLAKVRGTSEERFLIDAQRLYERALQSAGTQEGGNAVQNTFAGVKARTADLGALQTAQELEQQGLDADTIRRQTGWYRGMDGKWRFEIDDSGMEYNRNGIPRNPDMARRQALEQKLLAGTITQEEFQELRSLTAATRGVPGPSKLGDYIQHGDLFAAYPELAEVNVRFGDLEGGERGSFNRGTNIITLDQSLKGAPEDTLIHEVQHAIQQTEGFTGGSNPFYWASRDDRTGEVVQGLREEYGQVLRSLDRESANQFARYQEVERELERLQDAEEGLADAARYVQFEKESDRLYLELWDKPWFRKLLDLDRQIRNPSEVYNRYYRNTAGEIEARDAAARRQLTPEQRELRMPRLGDENTVFAEQAETARDYIPGTIGQDTVQQGILEVAGMESVVAVQGTEFAKGDVDLTAQVASYFDQLGGMVFNPQLGDVILNRRGVKSDISHGIGRKKAAAFAAVPSVLENGRVIDYQTNWKGRGYDTAVVAAPITIGGESYLAGVVLNRSQQENRFYVHEVLLTEKRNTAVLDRGRLRVNGESGGDVPSVLSLLRKVQEVKNNRSTDTPGAQNSMGRSFDDLVTNLRDGVELGEAGQYTMRGFDAEPELRMPRAERSAEEIEMEQRRAAEAEPEADAGVRAPGQGALETLLGGDMIHGDLADYRDTDFLVGADQGKKDTVRARKGAERRLQPTRGEKLFAKGIANGDYTAEDIPTTMSRATVTEMADYYTAENSYKGVDGVQERGREIRRKTEIMAEQYFKDDAGYKPIPMLVMNERTPERVMRSIFGAEQGEKINEAYIYPVQQNEAAKVRFIQRQLDAVRTFEDSTGKRSALTKEERAIVQQMMEDRFVGETVASMEMAKSIQYAAENIRKGADPVDAAKDFYLDTEEMNLAKQLARWTENQERLKSGKLDSVKINNAVEKYAAQYDLFYKAINEFLTLHGYGTIGFIKGYAPHMQGADTQNKLLSALRAMGVNMDASSLPTSISGLTADYKPGKRWNPFFQSRVGEKTDYDAAKGYESYVSYLGDILYHTDDIARLRGVSRYLRKTYGPEEITNAIDHAESLRNVDLHTKTEVLQDAGKITKGTKLTEQDARAMIEQYIDELYDDVTKITKYSELVKYIDNYANILAGKQSMADRGMEYTAGRTSLNAGNKLVAAFGRAQVAGNMSSVLNQSAQLSQILAEVKGKYVAQAAVDLAKSTNLQLWNIKKTALFDQSDLLTGKKGIDYLTADDSKLDSLVTAMFKPADIMDGLVSALAVQSKYNELVAEGKPSEAAMLEADRWATQVMASRAKGSRPLAFESKSVVSQMAHLFQVEAMNSMEHLTQDLPTKYRQIGAQYGKKAEARAVATVLTKGLLSAFLLNRAAEAAYGGTPAPFDVLGYLANFFASGFGMSTNEALKRGLKPIINTVWEKLFGEALLDDDDDEELRPFDLGSAGSDLLYNVSNDIPILSNVSGLLGLGDQTMPFANMAEAAKGVGQAVTAEDRSAGEIGSAVMELGSTLLPGGRQLQKTYQGVSTMLNGGRVYGYGDKARLQYTVEQVPDKWLQAVLFGNSGLSETRDFYASGKSGLSAKQTSVVDFMASEGADREAVYDAIQSIRKGEKTSGKLAALAEAENLTDRQKWQLYANIITTEDSAKVGQFREMLADGMSWQQISDAYTEYLRLNETEGMAASEKATQFAAYLDRSGLNEQQIGEVKDALKFYSQIPAEAGRYEKLTGAGLTSSEAEGLTAAIGDLKPQAGKTSVSDLQRYRAVVDYGLSESAQMDTLRTMMEDAEYKKLETACYAGLSPSQYVDFREATQNITSDKDAYGDTISGSKKEKVVAAIDAMRITSDQKTVLLGLYDSRYSADDVVWSLVPGLYTGNRTYEELRAAALGR